MKNLRLIVLTVGVVVAFSAKAGLLFEEDFDYGKGVFPLVEGEWFTQWDGASSLEIVDGLSFDGYLGSGIGNGVSLGVDDSYNPHHSFDEVASGNVYVGFMLKPVSVMKKGYFFALRDNQVEGYTAFNFNGRVSFSDDCRLGLTFADNQKAVYAEDALTEGETYLVVLKYAIKDGDNNDEVSVYYFSEMPAEEPETPAIGPLSDPLKTDIAPANVVLRGYAGNGQADAVIDGIRVATDWKDIIGGNSSVGSDILSSPIEVAGLDGAIQVSAPGVFAFEIFANNGTLVATGNTVVGNTVFPVPAGLYFVRVGTQVFKVAVR